MKNHDIRLDDLIKCSNCLDKVPARQLAEHKRKCRKRTP